MSRWAPRFAGVALVALLVALGALIASACAERTTASCGESDAAPVDPTLLAFLSRARSGHHIADQHEEDDQLEPAIEALARVIDGPIPGGDTPPAEAREVLADTRARLADLESRLGRFDNAAKHVERGLDLAREVTYFRGHLFEVRGLLEERRAKSLRDKGETDAADAAKKRALEAFEQSMDIQSDVIGGALGEEGGK